MISKLPILLVLDWIVVAIEGMLIYCILVLALSMIGMFVDCLIK